MERNKINRDNDVNMLGFADDPIVVATSRYESEVIYKTNRVIKRIKELMEERRLKKQAVLLKGRK